MSIRHTGAKGIYDIRVPQIVETVGFQSGIRQNFLKDIPDCRLGKMTAVRMCEDQIRESSVVPVASSRLFLRKLLGFMLQEHIHHELRRRQRPRLVVLQGAVLEFPPPFTRGWISCLVIRISPFSKSTQSQVSPSNSPDRIPVKSATMMSASYSWPFMLSISFSRAGVSSG